MIGAALRRRVGQGVGIAELKATLAGGLAALLTVGQGLASVAPVNEDEPGALWQDDNGSNDEDDGENDHDGHNHHPRGRGGRPAGYRHDHGPTMRDDKNDSSDSSDDSDSTDSDAAPSEEDPAEGEAPPPSGAAPVVDDASGGDNIQEGVAAPAASPVPSSSAAPIAAAPSDVDFVS